MQTRGGFFNEGIGGPVAGAVAYIDNEILQKCFTLCGVIDFRMKLNAKSLLALNGIARYFYVLGRANDLVIGRYFFDGIAMRHPDLSALGHAFGEDVIGIEVSEVGTAVFSGIRGQYFTTKMMC